MLTIRGFFLIYFSLLINQKARMKKIISFFFIFSIYTCSFASSGYYELPVKASETYISIGSNQKISLLDLSKIKRKSLEKLTGRKLNLIQRIGFKAIQNSIKKDIQSDGTVKKGKFIQFLEGGPATGFHAGGFLLGLFFFAPLGLILSYILGGEPVVRKNRIKWAWIGFGVVFLILVTWFILFATHVISLW